MRQASLDASADLEDWERIRQFIVSFCERNRISEKTCKSMQLVCEEWFINVVVHGFKNWKADDGPPFIRLSFTLGQSDEVAMQLQDSGPPFNPLEHKMPNVTLPAADRSIGGLGIYLMLKQAERSSYRRTEGKNELTLWIRCSRNTQESE